MTTCALCGRDAGLERRPGKTSLVSCPVCGRYSVDDLTRLDLGEGGPFFEQRWILSGVVRNASDTGDPVVLDSERIPELIRDAPIPRLPMDAIDRVLADLVEAQRRTGRFSGQQRIGLGSYARYYLPSAEDLAWLMQSLVPLGFANAADVAEPEDMLYLSLTAEGWRYAAEVERSRVQTWQAFVAMNFAPDLKPAYDEGIAPALTENGYEPVRVDRIHHNEKIDDRIIAELRRSGLVVADFTGHRGGVYFECGYAMGRGTHVIWCCRDTGIASVQFDTRQYNHLVWSEPADLKERLVDRIRATERYRDSDGTIHR